MKMQNVSFYTIKCNKNSKDGFARISGAILPPTKQTELSYPHIRQRKLGNNSMVFSMAAMGLFTLGIGL